jgi:hypothetical protein
VVTGLYFLRLTDEAATTFFEDTWTVAHEADRIGYRYRKGRALSFRERKQPFGAGSDPSNIVDAGYPYGAIQVPGGLEPIILHRDAVSGGGYAMIGNDQRGHGPHRGNAAQQLGPLRAGGHANRAENSRREGRGAAAIDAWGTIRVMRRTSLCGSLQRRARLKRRPARLGAALPF